MGRVNIDIDARQEAQAALRESEAKFRSLFEAMDEAFAICELVRDADGQGIDYRYVELNPALVRHVGISPESLLGRRASEVFGTVDPWLIETYIRVVDEGQSVLAEHHFTHVDRWLRINVFPRGGDRFAALYSDVTERHRAQEALRESERRQSFMLRFTDALRSEPNEQALVERAVQMLAEALAVDRAYATRHFPAADLTKVIHEVRRAHLAPLPATLRFSDFPEAGRRTFEQTLVFEDTADDQTLTETDKVALAAMGVGALLSRPLRRDGSPIFALGVVSTTPRRWTPAEIAIVEEAAERTWEAAERVRSEVSLVESEQKYRTLFDAMDEGLAIFDMIFDEAGAPVDFRYVETNAGFARQTGRRPRPGQTMREVFPEAEDMWLDLYATVAKTGEAQRFVDQVPGLDRWYDVYVFRTPVAGVDRLAAVFTDVTERKRAEEALVASEQRLRKMIEIETVGVVFFDLNGGITGANDAFLAMIGHTRDELERGEVRYEKLTRPEWRWRDEQTIAELRERGEAAPFMKEYFRKDRSRLWILCAGKLLDPATAVEFIIDVTEQRRIQQALQHSEERLRSFGEASQDILWIREAKTLEWTYLTAAFEGIYGVSRADALRGDSFANWLELIVPEDQALARDMTDRVIAGEQVSFEYRIRRPRDGKIRWLRDTDFPMRDEHGRVTSFGGIGQDITALKATEEDLRTSEERLRSAAEVAKFALWDWNIPTNEIAWSDEHFRMEGYAVGEVTPSYEAWAARIHPEDRAETEAALVRARDTRTEYAHEFRSLHPDGSVHWLSGRGRFFYDEAGQPVRIIGAMLEITERREWEERKNVLVAELQHRTRNLMGVVRSMSDKTARASADLADFRARFRDRLEALSRVQGLLSRLEEHDRVTFDELIRTELDVMDGDATRATLSGPPGVRLRSSTVQTLAMAIHELATNAMKYGALGQPSGHLAVNWTFEPKGDGGRPWLHVDWRESGVVMPEPGAPPAGTGQGRELIEKALPYQLGARTTYEFAPDGVRCTISIPVSQTLDADELAHV